MRKLLGMMIVVALSLFVTTANANNQEIEVIEECTLETKGRICFEEGSRHYGVCVEYGPNSCLGENPDYPGQCAGYPDCSPSTCHSGDYEEGDICSIQNYDIEGVCRPRCEPITDDCRNRGLICDISEVFEPDEPGNAGESDAGGTGADAGGTGADAGGTGADAVESDDDMGCSSVGAGDFSGTALFALAALGLVYCRRRKRASSPVEL